MRSLLTLLFLAFASVPASSVAFANTAPVLDASASPTLAPQVTNAPPPSGAVGTPIGSSLVDFVIPAGGLDNVTDVDPGALLGIAVVAADTTNGNWLFSTGAVWHPLGSVTTSSALLLAADPNNRLYFQPNNGFSGSSSITFVAWDQTSGVAGQFVSVVGAGGTSAFSVASDIASILVSPPPPTVSITGGTVSPTSNPNPRFYFTADGDGVNTTCAIDLGTPVACTSPFTSQSLANGDHVFQVVALDALGQSASDQQSFTVDTTPPSVTITNGPSGATADSTPTFSFTVGGDPVTTLCRVDGTAADNVACAPEPSSFTSGVLADGMHTFFVTAVDAAGNSAMDTRAFTTNASPPETTLLTSEAPRTGSTSGHFTFSSVPGCTFECREDLGAWTACSGASSLVGPVLAGSHITGELFEGFHTFEVRATNAFGLVDETPASSTWFVDLTAPIALLASKPAAVSNQASATFVFASEPGASFQCRVDAEAFAPCASFYSTAPLVDGLHTFDVRAVDLVGNVQALPTTYAWTIDLVAPDTFLALLGGVPTGPTASFVLTSSEASTFQCNLDGTGFVACSDSYTTPPLADGTHNLVVRTVDLAGNVDPTPAQQAWAVDTTAPETSITALSGNPTGFVASFQLSANETATFECSVDGGAFAPCASPFTTASLSEGEHTIEARATDLAGYVDATPASHTWLVAPASPNQLDKCQNAIASSSARYSQARTKALAKCHKARITGSLPFATDCRSDARTVSAIEKAGTKLKDTIALACGGEDRTCGGTLSGEVTPTMAGWPAACPGFQGAGCTNAITDCSGIADCLLCMDTTAVEQVISISFADLPETNPDTEGALNRCQAAFGSATARYLGTRSKILQKCWSGRFKGEHANVCPDPGDGAAAAAIAAADAKREATLCKACGGSDRACDGVDDLSPLDILGHAPACPPLITRDGTDCGAVGTVIDLAALNACSACLADFEGECSDVGAVPEFAPYPDLCSIPVPDLVSIDISPDPALCQLGLFEHFTATGTYSDGSSRDLTEWVHWSSSDETVATVSNDAGSVGVASPLQAGTTTINADFGAIVGSVTLTVY